MRRGIGHRLNTRINVRREVSAPDGGGGTSTSWQTVAELPARISQPSPAQADRERGDRSGAELTHQVYFAPGADVRRGDELHTADGMVLVVLSTIAPSVRIYLRADARQHQAQGDPR